MFMMDKSKTNRRGASVMRKLVLMSVVCVWPFAVPAGALQIPDEIKSGPQVGELIPGPLHYLNINGGHAGSPHCLVCEFGLWPTVALFTHELPEPGKPLAILLQKLDAAVGKYHDARLRSFAVFQNDGYRTSALRRFIVFPNDEAAKEEQDRKELIGRLEKAAADLDLKNLVLCVSPAAGPEKYNINKDAEVTVLLYDKLKVVENYTLPKGRLDERYINSILASVDQLVGAKKQ
jgi:hypothetical protein